MSKKMVVEQTSVTAAQMSEFWRQVAAGDLTGKMFQTFLEHRDPFGMPDSETQLNGWKDFYKKFFGVDLDLSRVRAPRAPVDWPGFDRLIVIAQGLATSRAYDVCAEHFECWYGATAVSRAIPLNDDRKPDQAYAIWVRNRVEADMELNNLSVAQLRAQGIAGITLLERMLYELKYWAETGKHLDVQAWTLCSGSCDADGGVPRVSRNAGRLEVYWDYSNGREKFIRARAVVS